MIEHEESEGCRYIVGELRSDEPWRYCGAIQRPGSSYCEDHHAVCYYRLRRRKVVVDDAVTTVYFTDIVDDAA